MNEKTQELASLYVLDKLTPDERSSFENLLETDTELVLLLRELESAVEDQVRDLPQYNAPDGLFSKIQSQVQPFPQVANSKPFITISWASFAGWGMAAALLLGVGLTLFVTNRDGPIAGANSQPVLLIVGMNSDSSAFKTIPTVIPEDEFENFVQLTQMAEIFWAHPEQLPATINNSPLANTRGSGYAVFDPQSKHGFIAIQNLPRQEKGKNYFLWLKDPKANVLECAGIIPLLEKNEGLYFFELEDNSPISSARVAFFVTEENTSEPKLSHPKGELVLGSDRI
ncbi:MAG: hypothetical protein O3C43_18815 [Verrucomicrobia bacterium]|nr:hypothetical protein [Verrucomicrobiota bacterium]MDA1068540.1 hypothetical protein [Verrucomicrobiota bacterium]